MLAVEYVSLWQCRKKKEVGHLDKDELKPEAKAKLHL